MSQTDLIITKEIQNHTRTVDGVTSTRMCDPERSLAMLRVNSFGDIEIAMGTMSNEFTATFDLSTEQLEIIIAAKRIYTHCLAKTVNGTRKRPNVD